jgi:hypothetical protein
LPKCCGPVIRLLSGLAYYLLPWEVWVQNYVDQQDAEAGLTSEDAAQE